MADEVVRKGPEADWIRLVDIPQADPARADQIKNGISWLLADEQIIHREHGYDDYSRTVYKIVDRPGLEQGAGIDLQFDPSRHKVTLNHLRIIRDGAVLDRLDDVKFDIFRQEKDAEKGIYDGWLTAHVNIDDVRVGDVVDYAETYEITPLVGKGLFFYNFSTEWEEPVGLIRTSITWPAAQPLAIKPRGTGIKPAISASGTDTVYLWEIADPKPVKVEDNVPAAFPAWGTIDVSSTASWQSVVDAVQPYYKPATTLPAAFSAKLDEIAARHPLPEDRMIQAMRLVQDEIRYVSLSMGSGSYIPRDPATVIQSGFGDCKDKALLLVSALARLGVSAQAALADLDQGRALDQHLPALRDFDHAIVKATIGEKTYWLDATNYLQGGDANDYPQPDYGFALPLFGNGALEKMPSQELTSPSLKVAEEFSFPDKPDGHLTLSVLSTYAGAEADGMRSRLASRSVSELSDTYLKYYSKRYPGIESTQKLEVFDNRDGNIVNVRESYQLSAQALAANDLAKNFPIKPADIGTDLPTPTMVDRVGPISLGSPVYRSHKMTVSNLKARFSGEDIKNVVTPYLSLKASWSNTPTTFEVEWNFRTLASEVPARAISDYLKSVKDVANNIDWTYDFTYQDAPENPPAPASDKPVPQLLTAMVLLSLFVVLPLYVAYGRNR
ncbi:DUF3857 domain-containing transglutaminase family protein [Mesorhizobium sp. B1-1-8]|uniref:DUF3857 domain-containing transglutaminase family protein n=1 Tax=Mesorhizobium sp. B1-1-8 TaxID=2589976 RepID=UPI0015E386D1|nr:DUF3857 domain-containing transglutaminase family protein [Mesorhizobium sp. B1-1-8]UCI08545.1 DUF3857 domain-containing transglutaminase family protein [Mesorhizobium sp. B1-1-8]